MIFLSTGGFRKNSAFKTSRYFLKNKKLSLSAFYKFTGKLPVFYNDNNQLVESSIDSYHILDFIINKALFNDRLKLKIGIKNLFDIQNH